MPDDRSHPLLQQTALAVNPFIDLPKPPTLPPNYTTLPFSTLPPSIINAAPASTSTSNSTTDSQLPAYVSTSNGAFAAHPSTIIAQNRGLLDQIKREGDEGRRKVEEWEEGIRERELQERRRKAPGWLDRQERILEPERKGDAGTDGGGGRGGGRGGGEVRRNLMDDDGGEGREGETKQVGEQEVEGLGEAMDRAFGRSEMG